MSLEKIGNAPVTNNGYFDVPICNEYSNVNQPRTIKNTNEFSLNNTIANTLNDNKQEYIVKQIPTRPSMHMLYQTDMSNSYYNKNYVNRYYDVEQFTNRETHEYMNNMYYIHIIILLIIILGFILFCNK